jgi:hypothetical protein
VCLICYWLYSNDIIPTYEFLTVMLLLVKNHMCTRRYPVLLVLIALLSSAVAAKGQDSLLPMTNHDVLKLVHSGMSAETIVMVITKAHTHFDTSTNALVALKTQGVPEKVIAAMLNANSGVQQNIPQKSGLYGIEVMDLSATGDDVRSHFARMFSAVVVMKIGKGTPAAASDIHPKDVIRSIENAGGGPVRIKTSADFQRAAAGCIPDCLVEIIPFDGKSRYTAGMGFVSVGQPRTRFIDIYSPLTKVLAAFRDTVTGDLYAYQHPGSLDDLQAVQKVSGKDIIVATGNDPTMDEVEIVVGEYNWRGEWSASNTYAVNDAVNVRTGYYVAIARSTGVVPGTDGGMQWKPMPMQSKIPGLTYSEGSSPLVIPGSQITSSQQNPTPIDNGTARPIRDDIKNEIEAIRRSPHEAMPAVEAVEAPLGGETSMMVENGTKYLLFVYFTGPVSQKLEISAGASQTVQLPPGNYQVAARVANPSVVPFYGEQRYGANTRYSEHFYIRTVMR